ncbi:hypothetical protein [Legionella bononiensis]|uniref:Ankyrin repeats (3 copies) n=1 Tax=Legionella bononiensis TaxID=2793102 RepID=A0ABS1WE61_9GAMM|nr:hypothetical protein [Legionella bononiensis]MBL7479561.1 hypothetical protein [Legionella bononiensis]MBL7527565.1 hypothetical protein [Legionella bononiensis]
MVTESNETSRDLFDQVIAAIKEEHIAQLATLLNQARTERYSDFSIMQDDDGNTIFHHLIMSGNLDLMEASLSYETGFNDSYDIKNKMGKTPYACIADLPDEKAEFKSIAIMNLGPSWRQSHILDQFRDYLKIQHDDDPEHFQKDDVLAIQAALAQGNCNGFAAIWLQCYLDGNEDKYVEIFSEIIEWDKSKESLSPPLKRKFEFAIGLARSYQMGDEIAWEHTQFEREYQNWNMQSPSHKAQKLFLSADNFFTKQKQWDKIWNNKKYKSEQSYASYFDVPSLALFLKQISDQPQLNRKGISIIGAAHAVAACINNQKFIYFDSNAEINIIDNKTVPSKTFDLSTDNNCLDAAREVFSSLNFKGEALDNLELHLTLSVYGKSDAHISSYPDIEEIKAQLFYNDVKAMNFSDIDPFKFIKFYDLLTTVLTKDEMGDMVDKARFSRHMINEIRDDGNNYTPLSRAIEESNTIVIELLLKSGANPKQILDEDTTPLSIAENLAKRSKQNQEIVTLLKSYVMNTTKNISVSNNKSSFYIHKQTNDDTQVPIDLKNNTK